MCGVVKREGGFWWEQWAGVSATGLRLIVTNVGRPPLPSFSSAKTTLTRQPTKKRNSDIWITINSLW